MQDMILWTLFHRNKHHTSLPLFHHCSMCACFHYLQDYLITSKIAFTKATNVLVNQINSVLLHVCHSFIIHFRTARKSFPWTSFLIFQSLMYYYLFSISKNAFYKLHILQYGRHLLYHNVIRCQDCSISLCINSS